MTPEPINKVFVQLPIGILGRHFNLGYPDDSILVRVWRFRRTAELGQNPEQTTAAFRPRLDDRGCFASTANPKE
jgi:hypothetical protein